MFAYNWVISFTDNVYIATAFETGANGWGGQCVVWGAGVPGATDSGSDKTHIIVNGMEVRDGGSINRFNTDWNFGYIAIGK